MCRLCREPLAVAQSPQADSERNYIRQLIAQGETKAQIEQALVGQYGEAVLGKPPADGFNLTVYILPPAILLAGIVILASRCRAGAGAPGRPRRPPGPGARARPGRAARLDARSQPFPLRAACGYIDSGALTPSSRSARSRSSAGPPPTARSGTTRALRRGADHPAAARRTR